MPLKPRDMKDYIASHYRADNTIAVIAGRFCGDKALKAVEKRLSCLPASAKKVGARRQPRFQKPVSEITVSKDVQQTQLALGYRTFGIADGRKYAASVFDAVMGRGMSSRLFQEVREKRGLSYDISSRMQFFSDAGIWSVTAVVDPAKAGPAGRRRSADTSGAAAKEPSRIARVALAALLQMEARRAAWQRLKPRCSASEDIETGHRVAYSSRNALVTGMRAARSAG
jgi:hypothetical protein